MNYNEIRRKTKKVRIGDRSIGCDAPVLIQSMTNTDTMDFDATLAQINALRDAGCDIVRVTAPVKEAAETFYRLKNAGVCVPLVADIHYDHRIALSCIDAGIDKIRINPGNIGADDRVKAVVQACRSKNIPIRIGVNSGSLEKEILAKYGAPTAAALAESAMYHVRLIEKYDYDRIVVSMKASTVAEMIEANRILADKCDYPLHLGVTEAGTERMALIKSAMGIGSLLCEGIGDTVRVSITGDPVSEVAAGRDILRGAGIVSNGDIDIVSCPTCGRTKVDLVAMVSAFEARAKREICADKPLKVAIMGCVVNGPGEAKEADFGLAGGKGEAVIFRRGEVVRKVEEAEAVNALIALIKENI